MNDLMDSGVFFVDVFEADGDLADDFWSREALQHSRRQRSHLRVGRIRQQHVAHRSAATLKKYDDLVLSIDASVVFHYVLRVPQFLLKLSMGTVFAELTVTMLILIVFVVVVVVDVDGCFYIRRRRRCCCCCLAGCLAGCFLLPSYCRCFFCCCNCICNCSALPCIFELL